MSFPTTPDALTNQWLSDTLGYQVSDFVVEHFSEGAGVMGLVTRLRLTGAGPVESIIAKFPSPSSDNRGVANTYNMYGREVAFYNDIGANLGLPIPQHYFGAFEPEQQDFVLLLQDLTDYRVGDQVAGCSAAEAQGVVRALAKMHAKGWNPQASLDLISHNNEAQCNGMIAGFQVGWTGVMERFREVIPDAALIAEHKMPKAISGLLQQMTKDPVCLTHADVRLDNIFFANNGNTDDVMFVDWQSVCTSAPEQDLAYFLTQSVPESVLESIDLKALYLDELRSHGVNYATEQFDERYRISALYLLCYAVVIAGTLDLGNERGMDLGRTLLGGSMRALESMNAFDLLQAF